MNYCIKHQQIYSDHCAYCGMPFPGEKIQSLGKLDIDAAHKEPKQRTRRAKKVNDESIKNMLDNYYEDQMTAEQIAQKYEISTATFYKYLKSDKRE